MWKHSTGAQRYCERFVRRAEMVQQADVVVQVQDLAVLDTPYLVFQDLSYDALLDECGETARRTQFPTLDDRRLKELRARQLKVYAKAAGVLAMSRWFADHLVRVTGLPAERVHVVHPGASALAAESVPRQPSERRRRLLLVGKDFARKGGASVVAALRLLRRDVDPDITLTVIGPAVWPLPGAVPLGVRFLGRLPLSAVAAQYAEHDVFVMPSEFDAFGIALVEALAHGLPCVARHAFAMPEIVRPGDNGALVHTDDPAELAAAIAGVLSDDDMFRRVAEQIGATKRHFCWQRAARDITAIAANLG